MERCSFCGKSKDQVEHLIQGGGKPPAPDLPVVYICNECVDLCAHIVHQPPPPTAVRKKEQTQTPERITDWAQIEVDGMRYRWSAVRTFVSEKLGKPGTPMVMILVGRIGEQAVGVLHPDGTQPTPELAVAAVGRMFATPEQD